MDVFQRVAVIAAVHQNISVAGGEHLAPAIWIAETGNEPLADLFPVRNLQCFRFSADTVPLQDLRDLVGGDLLVRHQLLQDLCGGILRNARITGISI